MPSPPARPSSRKDSRRMAMSLAGSSILPPVRCAGHRLQPHPRWRAASGQRWLSGARRQILTQPFAWDQLKRALRSRRNPDRIDRAVDGHDLHGHAGPGTDSAETKIVLIGDRQLLYLLSARPRVPGAVQDRGGYRGSGSAPAGNGSPACRHHFPRHRATRGCCLSTALPSLQSWTMPFARQGTRSVSRHRLAT